MTRKTDTPALSGDELRKRLAAAEAGGEKVVDVPLLGKVRVCVPTFERIIEIKMACQDEADTRLALVLASCPDLKPEDLSLLKRANGMVVASLVAAVVGEQGAITDSLVGK